MDLGLALGVFTTSVDPQEHTRTREDFTRMLYFHHPMEGDSVSFVLNHLQHAFQLLRQDFVRLTSLRLSGALVDFARCTRSFGITFFTGTKVFIYNLQFGAVPASLRFCWWHLGWGIGLSAATKARLTRCARCVRSGIVWRKIDFGKGAPWWEEVSTVLNALAIAFVSYLALKNAALSVIQVWPVFLGVDWEEIVFSSMGSSHFKGFVRLDLSSEGITVFPVLITTVQQWVTSAYSTDALNLTVVDLPQQETHFYGKPFTILR